MLESEAQRNRTTAGDCFTGIVQRILNANLLDRSGILVAPAHRENLAAALGSLGQANAILERISIQTPRPCDGVPLAAHPKGMLLALHRPQGSAPWRILSAIDCSVSLHSRQTEVCFWAMALKSVTRFVFVTEDREVHSARRRSELGRSCQEATIPRRLLETFTDGVYLVRRYDGLSSPDLLRDIDAFEARATAGGGGLPLYDAEGIAGHTLYCSRVRPLDDLVTILQKWSQPIRQDVHRLPGHPHAGRIGNPVS